MSDNLEIIMDIETLEVFEVIDLDKKDKSEDKKEKTPKENKATPYDDLGRVWLGNGYYYKSPSLLGKVVRDGIIHELSLRNKHGTYPYYEHSRDGTWGHVKQLTQEEALWLTFDFAKEMKEEHEKMAHKNSKKL